MKRSGIALLLLAACGGGLTPGGPGLPGGPTPPPRGKHGSLSQGQTIGSGGGSIALTETSGWTLQVDVPAGAVPDGTQFTLVELIIDPATLAGATGAGFEIDSTAPLAAAATLTFTAPAGTDSTGMTGAFQGVLGYWQRVYSGVIATSTTVQLATAQLGDWSVVTLAGQNDLVGSVTLTSTQSIPFTAQGNAITLQYLAPGSYLPQGTLTLIAPLTRSDGVTCSPITADVALPVSIADLTATNLAWGVNGQWKLACADSSTGFVSTNFDSFGITNIGCKRSFAANPVSSSAITEQYTIDCGPDGTIVASWSFARPASP